MFSKTWSSRTIFVKNVVKNIELYIVMFDLRNKNEICFWKKVIVKKVRETQKQYRVVPLFQGTKLNKKIVWPRTQNTGFN